MTNWTVVNKRFKELEEYINSLEERIKKLEELIKKMVKDNE